jgi:large subunit ribosomal protein L6
MSRIGRKPLEIPKGVQVTITPDSISTKGPKGTLTMKRHKDIEIKQTKDDDKKDVIVFERKGNAGPVRAAHGLMRALVGNMLTGVTTGFTRQLEINGVGYKAELKG